MSQVIDSPFASIENAHDFMTQLGQTIFETKLEIEGGPPAGFEFEFPPTRGSPETRFAHADQT